MIPSIATCVENQGIVDDAPNAPHQGLDYHAGGLHLHRQYPQND